MSIEYKDIMQCEKISSLPDGSYIVVISDGDMKIISKEDVKFGGGSVTEYRIEAPLAPSSIDSGIAVQESRSNTTVVLLKPDGTVATPQEVCDAYKSGTVIISHKVDSIETSELVCVCVSNEDNGVVIAAKLSLVSGDIVIRTDPEVQ